jgi:hypothetical protein
MAIAMAMFLTLITTENVSTMLRWSPPSKIFPQVPYIPHIMVIKKLPCMYFNNVTQTGIKGC